MLLMLVIAPATANAAPDYVSPGVEVSAPTTFIPGQPFIVTAGGFLPGETVSGTATQVGPDGLRSTSMLSAAKLSISFSAIVDASGVFSVPVTLPSGGTWIITVIGLTSGKTFTLTISTPPGWSAPPSTTSIAPGPTGGNPTSAPGATGTSATPVPVEDPDTSGLPNTGAGISVAAGLGIGGGALLVGLLLVFFGAKGTFRRRLQTH
ncbi:hypothetical protein D1871_09805 [Nakamurella silvestris]|nr:hypothetical protein D1871_09805 [Nakamurella silvestris]